MLIVAVLVLGCGGGTTTTDTDGTGAPDAHEAAAQRVQEALAALVLLSDIIAVEPLAETDPPDCPATEVFDEEVDGSGGCIDCGSRSETVELDWSVPACPPHDRPWLGDIGGDGSLLREWSLSMDGHLRVSADLLLQTPLEIEATRFDAGDADSGVWEHVARFTLGERVLDFDGVLERRPARIVVTGTVEIGATEIELVDLGVDPTGPCLSADRGEAVVRWGGGEARVEDHEDGLKVDIVPALRTLDPCTLPPWFVTPGAAPPTPMPPVEP